MPGAIGAERRRVMWVDMAKGIAILCVVIGHSVDVGSLPKRLIYTFHMPLFFILAGWTFRLRPLGEELRRSAARLLAPYALLFLVGPVRDALGRAPSLGAVDVAGLARSIAMGSGFDLPDGTARVGIAWFLAALFCARLLMCAVGRLCARTGAPRAVQGALVAALGALGLAAGWIGGVRLPLSLDVALVATPLLWCGLQARRLDLPRLPREGAPTAAAGMIAATALWAAAFTWSDMDMAARAYRAPLLALAGSLGATYALCLACRVVEGRAPALGRPLARAGRLSFTVLAVHATDWVIPWTYLPLLEGLPHPGLVAGVLRAGYCLAWAELAARTVPALAARRPGDRSGS